VSPSKRENDVSSQIARPSVFGQEQLEPRLLLAAAAIKVTPHDASRADLPEFGDYDGDGVVGCSDIAMLSHLGP
jgi:hypothetical protein